MSLKLDLQTKPPVIIETAQHDRLLSMADIFSERVPDVADRLFEELDRADIRNIDDMPQDIIKIGSELTYRDKNTNKNHTVALVWPDEADISKQKISVVTPVGAALIGLAKGATIDWRTNNGEIHYLTVLDVKN